MAGGVDVDHSTLPLTFAGLEIAMIMLCERCCAPIDDNEPMLRLAHIGHADAGGNITWNHTYVHTAACTTPCAPQHQRPDTGAWDPGRSIGAHRS